VIEKKTIPFPKPDPANLIIKVNYHLISGAVIYHFPRKVDYLGVNFIDVYYR
jgi:hypothetical protein